MTIGNIPIQDMNIYLAEDGGYILTFTKKVSFRIKKDNTIEPIDSYKTVASCDSKDTGFKLCKIFSNPENVKKIENC